MACTANEMGPFRFARSSTAPPTTVSEEDICHLGIKCNRRHELDDNNPTTRDIIRSICGRRITDNEIIEFKEGSGEGTDQNEDMLRVSAIKEAARLLGVDTIPSTRNRLAWKIVRLHEELRMYQDFCPFILAKALLDPNMQPQAGVRRVGIRRAHTMVDSPRLGQNGVYRGFKNPSTESYQPEDGYHIELWIVVGVVGLIASGLLLSGKRPRFLRFS